MADNREKWKMKMDFLLTVSDVSGLPAKKYRQNKLRRKILLQR
jgi:hypothetical protein